MGSFFSEDLFFVSTRFVRVLWTKSQIIVISNLNFPNNAAQCLIWIDPQHFLSTVGLGLVSRTATAPVESIETINR